MTVLLCLISKAPFCGVVRSLITHFYLLSCFSFVLLNTDYLIFRTEYISIPQMLVRHPLCSWTQWWHLWWTQKLSDSLPWPRKSLKYFWRGKLSFFGKTMILPSSKSNLNLLRALRRKARSLSAGGNQESFLEEVRFEPFLKNDRNWMKAYKGMEGKISKSWVERQEKYSS